MGIGPVDEDKIWYDEIEAIIEGGTIKSFEPVFDTSTGKVKYTRMKVSFNGNKHRDDVFLIIKGFADLFETIKV